MTPSASGLPSETLLEEVLARADDLPLGNRTALLRVTLLCEEPGTSARDVALEVSKDEGLAAMLLRLANSAASAPARPIADLTTVVARLGLGLVRSLAIAAPGLRLLGTRSDGLGPVRRELHRHSARVGVAARMIAPADIDSEQALTAGLVHDIGLSVLARIAPDEFRRVLDLAAEGVRLPDAERWHLGFTHAELGARLAERWSYPDTLVEAIADQSVDRPPRNRFCALVRVADALIREHGIGIEPPILLDPAVYDGAGVEPGRARAWLEPVLISYERVELRDEIETAPLSRARVARALLAALEVPV